MNWYQLYKQADKEKSYGWVALELPDNIIKKVKDFQKKIDKKDLHIDKEDWHGYGLEKEPHITVKYGLKTEDAEEVKKVLEGESGGKVSYDSIDIFKADEHDVLVMRMKSKDLARLHKTLKKNLKNDESFPIYKPHATIAYLLVGKGEEYKKMAEDYFEDGFTFDFDEIFFEDKDDNRADITLA
jgi:2'-5' RNA ligase